MGLVHCFGAVLSASEVWVLAFETLEIGVDGHCILVLLLKVRRFRVLQLFILIATLKFQPLKRHILNLVK